jgi:hypothetical protein
MNHVACCLAMLGSIPVMGVHELEARFARGMRVRLLVRVRQRDLRIVGVLPKA